MKKVAVNLVLSMATFAILALVFNATIGNGIRKGQHLQADIPAQKGRSVEEAKRVLGEPFRIVDFKTYKESLDVLSQSLEPDPPLIECHQVLDYQEFASVGMLFVKNGIVVGTYVGGT